jgi:cytoskeletal protein RodZ
MVDESDSVTTVGERLRAARESQGLSLEEVASRTRIPTRHLESLEISEWGRLPAPTYSIGFAKAYASVVGLDRTQVGEDLRTEMGGTRLAASETQVFEPADPARVMPKWLVLAAVLGVLALVAALLIWRQQSLTAADEPVPVAAADPAPQSSAPAAAATPAPAPAATGPVVLTASEPVWLQVYQRGGPTLFQGELTAGQTYEVPATATAPLLRTGKPEALRVTVGTTPAPPVGPAAVTVRDVSLLGPDLMRGQAATPAVQPAAPPR